MRTHPERGRIVVIGLAEASPHLIDRFIEAGELPTLRTMRDEGCTGRLRSRIPLITPQMWSSIATGQPPGVHGLFDFWQRGPDGRFREMNGSQRRAEPIWQILSRRGIRSGIVNVPFTYPPDPIDGYVIAGEDAPGAHRSIASPPELFDAVTKRFGRYRLKDIFPGGRAKSDYLGLIGEDVAKQTDVLEYLVTEHPTDFFLAFYSASAIAQHYFWSDMESDDPDDPYRDVILDAYRCLDRAIARLTRAAGPDAAVYVISECGAGPLAAGVQIAAWLEREGFLCAKHPAGIGDRRPARQTQRLRHLAARFRTEAQGRLPKDWFHFANRRFHWLKAAIQTYLEESAIDWSRTRVFSRGKEGHLFVNLKGRDPHGIVAPGAEYESLLREVEERLLDLTDPATGAKAVDAVLRAEEIYAGPWVPAAPDLTIAWHDTAYMPTESDRDEDEVFVTRRREYMKWPTSGAHRIDGCFFARGPGIRRGKTLDGLDLLRLVPTWLHALRQPVPAELPGEVIRDLFDGGEVG